MTDQDSPRNRFGYEERSARSTSHQNAVAPGLTASGRWCVRGRRKWGSGEEMWRRVLATVLYVRRVGSGSCSRSSQKRPRDALKLSEHRSGYEPESTNEGVGRNAPRNWRLSLPANALERSVVRFTSHHIPSRTLPLSDRRKASSACFSSAVRSNGRISGSRCGLALPPRL